MCRFILVSTKQPSSPQDLLCKFAHMTQKSHAPDGDWQGDGWGVSWYTPDKTWQRYTSLKPIWECTAEFSKIPRTTCFMAHARSASFIHHKGIIAYNQPYTTDRHSFVFNGLLKGVSFPRPLAGTIGAQKIHSLLRSHLAENDIAAALNKTTTDICAHTKQVQALNVGFSDGKNLYAFCTFDSHPEYYTLRVHSAKNITIICSEQLESYTFSPLETNTWHRF